MARRRVQMAVAAVLATVWVAGCGTEEGRVPPRECVWTAEGRPEELFELGCPADFESVASPPLVPLYGEVDSVKVQVDTAEDDLVLFVDGLRWRLHFDYVAEKRRYCEDLGIEIALPPDRDDPGYQACHEVFGRIEYNSADRRYLFATIEHYRALDLYTLEFAAGDEISAEQVAHAWRTIGPRLWNRDDLRLRPTSLRQQERFGHLARDIPMVPYDQVMAGQTYQPLNVAVAYGYLRSLPGSAVVAGATPRDIVLSDEVPIDLPVVSGLITETFQAPLSHVNVLSHARGTPNMALAGALTDPRVAPFVDQLVRLDVGLAEFSIAPAALDEAEAYWEARRPPTPWAPAFDLSVTKLVDLRDVRARHPPPTGDGEPDWIPIIGAKATNLGELMQIEGVPTVDAAFAIPVWFYEEHLVENGIDQEIDALLEDPAVQTDLGVRRERLAELREAIATSPPPEELIADLEDELAREFPHDRMRFRSSSNAEDLQGFNGAGLYESNGASLDDGIEAVSEAVRRTWASLWSDRAFEERDFYRIDQRATKMAILSHRACQGEVANGVAITGNPFRQGSQVYFVNAQIGDVSVVFSEAMPEQFLYYRGFLPPEVVYLSRSSLTFGAPVLAIDEIEELVEVLRRIHEHFADFYAVDVAPGQYAMDVEWKLDADGAIVIKQARPYL